MRNLSFILAAFLISLSCSEIPALAQELTKEQEEISAKLEALNRRSEALSRQLERMGTSDPQRMQALAQELQELAEEQQRLALEFVASFDKSHLFRNKPVLSEFDKQVAINVTIRHSTGLKRTETIENSRQTYVAQQYTLSYEAQEPGYLSYANNRSRYLLVAPESGIPGPVVAQAMLDRPDIRVLEGSGFYQYYDAETNLHREPYHFRDPEQLNQKHVNLSLDYNAMNPDTPNGVIWFEPLSVEARLAHPLESGDEFYPMDGLWLDPQTTVDESWMPTMLSALLQDGVYTKKLSWDFMDPNSNPDMQIRYQSEMEFTIELLERPPPDKVTQTPPLKKPPPKEEDKKKEERWRFTIDGWNTLYFGGNFLAGGLRVYIRLSVDFTIKDGRYAGGSGTASFTKFVNHTKPAGVYQCDPIKGTYLDKKLGQHQVPFIRYRTFGVPGSASSTSASLNLPLENDYAVRFDCLMDTDAAAVAGIPQKTINSARKHVLQKDVNVMPGGTKSIPLIGGWTKELGNEKSMDYEKWTVMKLSR